MFNGKRQTSLGSFLLGGLLGGVAGVLAAWRLKANLSGNGTTSIDRDTVPFEEAPCHQEWEEHNAESGSGQ